MGNRAVITTKDRKLGVYVHWNARARRTSGATAQMATTRRTRTTTRKARRAASSPADRLAPSAVGLRRWRRFPQTIIVTKGASMPHSKKTFTPQDADLRRITEAFSRLKTAGRDDRDIWSAFVTMAAAPMAMAAGCAPGSLVEDAERRFKRYDGLTDEFDEMLSALTDALEADSDRDVMGHVYNALGLPMRSRSQFFTPYGISRMIARMMLSDSAKAKEKGYVTICDHPRGLRAYLQARGRAERGP